MESTTPEARARARLAQVSAVLGDDLPTLSRALHEVLASEIVELDGDQLMLDLLRASGESNVETFLHFARYDIPIEEIEAPAAALEYSRRLAQRGISSNALQRAYRLGQRHVMRIALDLIAEHEPDREVALATGLVLLDKAFAYIDAISEKVVSEYEEERERWLANRTTVRATALRAVLSGDTVEEAAAEQAWLDLPQVEVQDNLGRYRGEDSWPPADAVVRTSTINGGAYTDNGLNFGSPTGALVSLGTAPVTGDGIWSFSQPLPGDRHLAGEPVLDLDLAVTAPRTNVVGNVYDIAPDGTATLVSRGADMIRLPGLVRHRLQMYGQDWVFAEGHRIGVLISGSNAEWWVHQPTQSPVAVIEAFAELPLLDSPRTEFDAGGFETNRLRQHNSSTFTVPAPVITLNETPFNVG